MNLFYDNKATIDISHNTIQHDQTKHVEVDRHIMRQNLDAKIVLFLFVKFEDQPTDILTKAVCGKVFNNSRDKLGMRDLHAPTKRGVSV